MNANYLAIWVLGLAITITVAVLVIRWFINYVYDTYDYSVIDWPSLITLAITMILSTLILITCINWNPPGVYNDGSPTPGSAVNSQVTFWFNILVFLLIFIRNGIKTSWVCALPITIMQIATVTIMVPILILGTCKAADIFHDTTNKIETTKQFGR